MSNAMKNLSREIVKATKANRAAIQAIKADASLTAEQKQDATRALLSPAYAAAAAKVAA